MSLLCGVTRSILFSIYVETAEFCDNSRDCVYELNYVQIN